jgi:cytochrome P450
VLDIVARVSSRIFLGQELCRDEKWLDITKTYTIDMFVAAAELRRWPQWSRPFIHWFLPRCKKLRMQFLSARRVLSEAVRKRQEFVQTNKTKGSAVQGFDDAIEWARDQSKAMKSPIDEAKFQLTMSVAAMHTTSDILTQVIIDLAQHPEVITALRKETSECLHRDGWTKSALYNMNLLDSTIKETQRLKPASIGELYHSMSKSALRTLQRQILNIVIISYDAPVGYA